MANESTVEASLEVIDEQISAGRLSDAESSCLRLLEVAPRKARVWFQLGVVRLQSGRHSEAEKALRTATALAPDRQSFWSVLGAALLPQGRSDDAVHAYQSAIRLDSTDATSWSGLGDALWSLGRLDDADVAYQRSLEITTEHLPTLMSCARLLLERREFQRALKVLEKVVNTNPTFVAGWLAAGDAFVMGGDDPQARSCYQRALALAPADREVQYKIADAFTRHGLPSDAEPAVQQLVATAPQSADAWSLLALLRQRQVRLPEAIEALNKSLALVPTPTSHSNLLSLLQYDDSVTPEKLLTAHRQWDAKYASPLDSTPPPIMHRRTAARPLRLGFVSKDFTRHPVGYLVLPALEHLDKSQCTLFCYSDRLHEDEYTARFRAAANAWQVTQRLSDEDLAAQVRKDEIDILFDLMGHNGNRLLMFARKPAPLQITWMGYVGTTGLRAMDFLLADRFHVRPGEEVHYSEGILRMPNGYACYGPPASFVEAPPVGPLPALQNGHVTFGSFNNPLKISPPTIDAWAAILGRVPQSRLLLRFGAFEFVEVRDRIKIDFAQRQIDPSRVLMEGWGSRRELLETYNRVDLALDTQPYSGGLTTCEALWMGVPVITYAGKTFAGRHSTSHLTNAGYGQFVAEDSAGYVELAVQWASRIDELAAIRSQMRDQVRKSPLCDAPQFAHDFLAVLTQAWESGVVRR